MSDRLSQLVKTLSLESEEMQDVPMEQEGLDVPEEQEEFEQTQHENLDEVRESETLSDQLDTLSGQVEEAPEGAALEHYHWMMSTLLSNAKMPTTKSVALENFTNSDSGKTLLAKGIKGYNRNLKRAISVALEAYVDNYARVVSENIEKHTELSALLKKAISEFKEKEVIVKLSSQNDWRLFHVDGKLISQSGAIRNEIKTIETLVSEVSSKMDTLVSNPSEPVKLKTLKKHTMFNRTISMDESGCVLTEEAPPEFKAPVNRNMVMAFAAAGIIFTGATAAMTLPPLGALAAAGMGGGVYGGTKWLQEKIRALIGTVTTKDKVAFISEVSYVTDLADSIDTLDQTVMKFSKALSEMTPEEARLAKRNAAPVIEAIGVLVKHINDLTAGLTTVFGSKLKRFVDYTEVNEEGKVKGGISKGLLTGNTRRSFT